MDWQTLQQKYNTVCQLYEHEKQKNNQQALVIEQRQNTIENLLKEISRKDIKTHYLKDADCQVLRQKWENTYQKLQESRLLIERYIGIIQELYQIIEKLTGAEIDKNMMETLNKDQKKINQDQDDPSKYYSSININSSQVLEDKFEYSFISNDQNENSPNDTMKAIKNDIYKKYASTSQANLTESLQPEHKKTILLEYNTIFEEQIMKLICERFLIFYETKANFCNLNEKEVANIQKLGQMYQLKSNNQSTQQKPWGSRVSENNVSPVKITNQQRQIENLAQIVKQREDKIALQLIKEKSQSQLRDKIHNQQRDKSSHLLRDKSSNLLRDKSSNLLRGSNQYRDKSSNQQRDKSSNQQRDKSPNFQRDKSPNQIRNKSPIDQKQSLPNQSKRDTSPNLNDKKSSISSQPNKYHSTSNQFDKSLKNQYSKSPIKNSSPKFNSTKLSMPQLKPIGQHSIYSMDIEARKSQLLQKISSHMADFNIQNEKKPLQEQTLQLQQNFVQKMENNMNSAKKQEFTYQKQSSKKKSPKRQDLEIQQEIKSFQQDVQQAVTTVKDELSLEEKLRQQRIRSEQLLQQSENKIEEKNEIQIIKKIEEKELLKIDDSYDQKEVVSKESIELQQEQLKLNLQKKYDEQYKLQKQKLTQIDQKENKIDSKRHNNFKQISIDTDKINQEYEEAQ